MIRETVLRYKCSPKTAPTSVLFPLRKTTVIENTLLFGRLEGVRSVRRGQDAICLRTGSDAKRETTTQVALNFDAMEGLLTRPNSACGRHAA